MIKVNVISKIFTSLLLGLFLSVSHAQSPLGWGQLTVDEQQVLASYKNDWQQMSVEDQLRLQKVARNWQQMTPAQKKVMQQHSEQWKKMPEATKLQIRARYQQFEKLSPEKKQKIIQRMNKFQALPKQEREALRHRWQQQIQQQRKAGNELLPGKKDNKVTSINDNLTSENEAGKNMEENGKTDEQAESSADSKLDNNNRIQNNRLDTQRINRPMRRTR